MPTGSVLLCLILPLLLLLLLLWLLLLLLRAMQCGVLVGCERATMIDYPLQSEHYFSQKTLHFIISKKKQTYKTRTAQISRLHRSERRSPYGIADAFDVVEALPRAKDRQLRSFEASKLRSCARRLVEFRKS
jgi:hypothetical protein